MNHQKNDCIYILGFPKSGNSWLIRLITELITAREARSIENNGRGKRLAIQIDLAPDTTPSALTTIRTHLPPHLLTGDNHPRVERAIYIYRDFRDVVVSGFFHLHSHDYDRFLLRNAEKKSPALTGNPLTVLRHQYWCLRAQRIFIRHTNKLCREGWSPAVGDWSTHIRAWQRYANDNPSVRISFVSYEELLADTRATLRRLLSALDVATPTEQWMEHAMNKWSFESERKYYADLPPDSVMPSGRTAAQHFRELRKGRAGDWKNYLTKRTARIIDQRQGTMLRELGYVADHRWYSGI